MDTEAEETTPPVVEEDKPEPKHESKSNDDLWGILEEIKLKLESAAPVAAPGDPIEQDSNPISKPWIYRG